MNNEFNKELKKYFKEIKKKLNCKSYLKLGYLTKVKADLNDFINSLHDSERTIAIIRERFGTPETIAKSFDNIEDLTEIRDISKKIIITQAVTIVIMTIVIIILVIVLNDVFSNSQNTIIVNRNY